MNTGNWSCEELLGLFGLLMGFCYAARTACPSRWDMWQEYIDAASMVRTLAFT